MEVRTLTEEECAKLELKEALASTNKSDLEKRQLVRLIRAVVAHDKAVVRAVMEEVIDL